MKADLRLGGWLLMLGTHRARTWWRWVPVWAGPVYGRRWWHVRGVIVGAFRWSFYMGLVRL